MGTYPVAGGMSMAAVVVLAVALVVTVLTGARLLASERRQAARERDLLLNQLLHATGHTWQPPPVEEPAPPADVVERVVRYTATPEQFPA